MLWIDQHAPWEGSVPVVCLVRAESPAERRNHLLHFAATALRRPPERVEIAHRDGQAPSIVSPPHAGLHCSSASRRGVAALALARDPIGVDVEAVGREDEIPWRVLHPSEAAWLREQRSRERARAFARLWSLKEAYLKALGTGLGREPASFSVAFAPEGGFDINDPVGTPGRIEIHTRVETIQSGLFAVSAILLRP